ncbi:general substrate transporter [Massariosphaeria phaeospora]|uniref:General substrate transporter n=1 Tax=Massariosphaeria phaeospora TaxID=100035 RepID=A0A7C8MB15_9PLEO|nr:general substrate transporter [Massariosphaeria phaeospora]
MGSTTTPSNAAEYANTKAEAATIEETETNTNCSASTFASKSEELPLGKAVRQYSKFCLYLAGLLSVVLLFGYDLSIVGVITSVPAFQKDYGVPDTTEAPEEDKWILPGIWVSLLSAMPSVGMALGAALGGILQDRMGRRRCLQIGSSIIVFSVLIIFLSNKPPSKDGKRGMLLAGKMIQGFAVAIMKITTLTYISENVPVALKGMAMALFPAITLLGQLTGALVVFACEGIDNQNAYLIALASQWALSIAPFVMSFLLPESPPYLIAKGDIAGARNSLTRLLAPKNDVDIALQKLRHANDTEADTTEHISYMDCFNSANRRRSFIIIYANFLPQLFGLPLLSSVSYFLQQVGMKPSTSILFLIGGILCGLAANVGSSWTLSNIGRRKLTVTTLLIAAALWSGMGISGFWHNDSITPWSTAAIAVCIIVVCGLGCWPASYAIMSETSALRLRAKSQAIGGMAAYTSTIVANFVLPFFYNPDYLNLKAKTGFVHGVLSLIAAFGMWILVPEMKGRSIIETDQMFDEKVPARMSTKWKPRVSDVRMANV